MSLILGDDMTEDGEERRKREKEWSLRRSDNNVRLLEKTTELRMVV